MVLSDLITAFTLGLLTPLTAVCVLPLYPGFITYLSNRVSEKSGKKELFMLGLLITSGVILFMFLLGLIFTYLLKISLTEVIGIVSPIAFGILGIISVLLILDFDFSRIFPDVGAPEAKNPYVEALLFGFFFGAIVVPCNPAFIAALFVKSLNTVGFYLNLLQFVFFGLGIGFPLLVLAGVSAAYSRRVIGFLTEYKTAINRITGVILLGISLYYLIFVFGVIG